MRDHARLDTPLERLRTLGIVAHIDAGKTTLTERILFDTGAQSFCGDVDEGTATMDWLRQEQERGISILAAATRVRWQDHELQIVDTPGHVDFTAEVERCLRVLDGVVVVLDGVRGVESQTMTVWRRADRWRCARLVFVNKMDRVGADFDAAVRAVAERFDCRPVPVVVPLRDDASAFAGLGDPVTGAAQWFAGEPPADLVPALSAQLRIAREAVVMACAEIDEAILADFVHGREIEPERLQRALRRGCVDGAIVPVLCGAALHDRGVDWLLDAICDLLPSPGSRQRAGLEDAFPPADAAAPLQALVFKVEHAGGEVRHYVRVFAGVLRTGQRVVCRRTRAEVAVTQLWSMRSSHHEEVDAAGPGEIVVLPGSHALQTGDTLHDAGAPRRLPMPPFSPPVIAAIFEPATPRDEEPLLRALAELRDDDPTLRIERDPDTGLPLVLGMGELHLEITAERVRERANCAFSMSKPRVALRSTVARRAEGRATVQEPGTTPPIGAEAAVAIEPWGTTGSGAEAVVDTAALAGSPFAAVVAAELEARAGAGLVHGRAAADVRLSGLEVTADGPIDDALVAQAVRYATDRAIVAAGPLVLEPMVDFEVRCPPEHRSVLLADLVAHGAVMRQVSSGQLGALLVGRGRLQAFLGYATRLRSLTKGQGEVQLQPRGLRAIDTQPEAAMGPQI